MCIRIYMHGLQLCAIHLQYISVCNPQRRIEQRGVMVLAWSLCVCVCPRLLQAIYKALSERYQWIRNDEAGSWKRRLSQKDLTASTLGLI